MLTTLRIDPDALLDWAWDGTRYTAPGGGVIEPYAHPMTEHAAVTDGIRTTVILRERTQRRPGLPPAPTRVAPRELHQVTAMARQWPADYVLIEPQQHRPVRVTAGAPRATPLYLAHQGGVLHGAWDMGRLRPFAAGLNPKPPPPSAATCISATPTPSPTPCRANSRTAATCSPRSPRRSTPPWACAPSTPGRRRST